MRRLAPFLLLLAACGSSSSSLRKIPREWMSVPVAKKIAAVALDAAGKVTEEQVPPASGPIRVEGNRLFNGDKALTEPFAAIDSFAFSEARGEVVFSAKRDRGFDVGLVSSDGSAVNWVPSDPADEVAVQWAPRGNKVSYVLRAHGGDVVRTLHIPTSYQLTVPFLLGTIQALAWDPPAERYAVVWSSPDGSDRVEVVRYGGEDRRMAILPDQIIDVDIEPMGRDALLLRPRDVGYGEKLPIVIWMTDGFGWNDALAALMRRSRLACILTVRPPDEALLASARAMPWADGGRTWLVDPSSAVPAAAVTAGRIGGDPSLPAGRYRLDGASVTVLPAVVQSFAAGYLPDHLKRTSRTNGSSR